MVKTVTLTAGTPQEVKFPEAYPFYWIDNKTSGDVYASVGGTPEADADGTYTISAGSQLRISGGVGNGGITLLGEGNVQVVASGIASCPFKSAMGGGGIKYINGIAAVNGELALTQSLIPSDGTAYQFPYYIQSGTVTVNNSTDTAAKISVTFPVSFKSAPILLLSSSYSLYNKAESPVITNYDSLSNQGFILRPWRYNKETVVTNTSVNWVALGILEE